MALVLACGAKAPEPQVAVPDEAPAAVVPKVQLPGLPPPQIPPGLLAAVRIKNPDTLGIPLPNGAKEGTGVDAFVVLKGQGAECAFAVEVGSADAMVEAMESGARPLANGAWRVNSPNPCVIVPQPGEEPPKMACSCEKKPVSDETLSFAASSLWVPDKDSDVFAEVLMEPLRERLPQLDATKRQALMAAGAMLRSRYPAAERPALQIIDLTFQEVNDLAHDIGRITLSGSFNEDQSLHGELLVYTQGAESWVISQSLKAPLNDPQAWKDFWQLPAKSTFAGVNFNQYDWSGPYGVALNELAHIGLNEALNATPKEADTVLEIVPMLRDWRFGASGDFRKECGGFAWTIMAADGAPKDAVASIDELSKLWDASEHSQDRDIKIEKQKTPRGAPGGSALYAINGVKGLAGDAVGGKAVPYEIAVIPIGKQQSWFVIGCDAKVAFDLYKATKNGKTLGGNQTLKKAVPEGAIHGFGMLQADEGPPATYYTDIVTQGMPVIRTVFNAPPGWFTAMKLMIEKIDPDFDLEFK